MVANYDPEKHVLVNTQNVKVRIFDELKRTVTVQPIRNVDDFGRPRASGGVYVLEGNHYLQFVGPMGPLSVYERKVAEVLFQGNPFPGPSSPAPKSSGSTPKGESVKSVEDAQRKKNAAVAAKSSAPVVAPAGKSDDVSDSDAETPVGKSASDVAMEKRAAANDKANADATEEDAPEADEDEEEVTLSVEGIMAMKKAELVELIDNYELDVELPTRITKANKEVVLAALIAADYEIDGVEDEDEDEDEGAEGDPEKTGTEPDADDK